MKFQIQWNPITTNRLGPPDSFVIHVLYYRPIHSYFSWLA